MGSQIDKISVIDKITQIEVEETARVESSRPSEKDTNSGILSTPPIIVRTGTVSSPTRIQDNYSSFSPSDRPSNKKNEYEKQQ